MRYTTIIDLSEFAAIYRNANCRLLYLHMAIKSGYHDEDRDILRCSIRALAADSGLSVAAVRHALKMLEREKLVTRIDGGWRVLKWVVAAQPTPRVQPPKQAAKAAASTKDLAAKMDAQIEEARQRVYAAVRIMTREELEAWLTELQHGQNKRHHGAYINPNKANIEWLQKVINGKPKTEQPT